MDRFQVEARRFDSLALDVRAAASGASVSNGVLSRDGMNAAFNGAVGLRNWEDRAHRARLATGIRSQRGISPTSWPWRDKRARATPAWSPRTSMSPERWATRGAGASVQIDKGEIRGEPFDAAQFQASMSDRLIAIPTAFIATPAGRIDVTAEFQHPLGSFDSGQVRAHVQSGAVQLAQVRTLQAKQPGSAGQVALSAEIAGELSRTPVSGGGARSEFLPSSVTAEISARGLRFQGQDYGNLTASARTRDRTVDYSVSSDFAGSALRVDGNTQLVRGYPTDASARLSRLPVERVLALAKADIPCPGLPLGAGDFSRHDG